MPASAGAPPTMQPIAEGGEEQDTAVETPSLAQNANNEEERQQEHGDSQSSANRFDFDSGRDDDSDDEEDTEDGSVDTGADPSN